jgi:hypothetical protein
MRRRKAIPRAAARRLVVARRAFADDDGPLFEEREVMIGCADDEKSAMTEK